MRIARRNIVVWWILLRIVLSFLVAATTTQALSSSSPSPATNHPKKTSPSNIRYRRGRASDSVTIGLLELGRFQLPFGRLQVDPNNLLVAETLDDQVVVGWAQLRPLGYAQQGDPRTYDARPGSYDIQAMVDDQMWQEFEEDESLQVPTGWASLPWTPEYRALEAGIQARKERREELVEQALREQKATQIPIWQLQQVFVTPAYRGQGIGTTLIQTMFQEYAETGKRPCDLYVATSKPAFWEDLGCFERVRRRRHVPLDLTIQQGQTCLRGKQADDEEESRSS